MSLQQSCILCLLDITSEVSDLLTAQGNKLPAKLNCQTRFHVSSYLAKLANVLSKALMYPHVSLRTDLPFGSEIQSTFDTTKHIVYTGILSAL